MSQFQVGDLVWIPQFTNAYTQRSLIPSGHPWGHHRYNIDDPTYGLVIETSEVPDVPKVKVCLGKTPDKFSMPTTLWFKSNEIYKHNGDAYGKIC